MARRKKLDFQDIPGQLSYKFSNWIDEVYDSKKVSLDTYGPSGLHILKVNIVKMLHKYYFELTKMLGAETPESAALKEICDMEGRSIDEVAKIQVIEVFRVEDVV